MKAETIAESAEVAETIMESAEVVAKEMTALIPKEESLTVQV